MPNYNPISPQQLAMMGRDGDTMLAHINAEEAMMLKQMGGRGTINPMTGLREFAFGDDNLSWGTQWQDGGYGSDFGYDDYYGGDYGGGYNDYYDYGGGFNQVDVGGGYNSNDLSLPVIDQPVDTGGNFNDFVPPVVDNTPVDTGSGSWNDFVPPVVDDTPVDTGPVVPDFTPVVDDTPVDTGPDMSQYWADLAAQQQADWQAQADAQAAEWQRQADERDRLANEANQREWERQAAAQRAADLQAQLDAAASVIGGDTTLINDYVGNNVGSINNGTNTNNITVIPGSGSTTTGLLDGYVPTEYANTSIVTGPVTPDIVAGTGANIPVVDLTGGGANTVITDITTGSGNVINDIINGTGNLVQIGDDTYLDTTTGAVVTGNGDTILAPIVTDTSGGTLVASANTGTDTGTDTVTDTGNIQTGLNVTGVGTSTTTTADQLTGQSKTAYDDLEAQYQNLLVQRDDLINGDYTPDQILAINTRIGDLLRTQDSVLAGTYDFNANPYPGRNVDYIVDTVLGTQYAYDKDTGETLGPTITYNGQVGVGDVIIQDQDFSGNTANLSGSSGGGNITYSNVTLGDANVANVTGGSNANITMDNVTGGNVTGVSGPVIPGTGNITITDSTMGNVANIDTTTSNLSVGNATTNMITNTNSNLTTSNIANTIANSISNSTSNVTNTNISNTFANTIANVLSNIANTNISNTTVGNITDSLSNISNTNISNTQANNISNVISLFTDGNISNSIVNTINNSVSNLNNVTISNTFANTISNVISNINNANISNTVVGNISNVISNVSNSNISNSIVNNITNSISNISNVTISNSTANTLSNVASNIANVIVANTTANIANIITTGNTVGNGNANIDTLIITANTLANANVIANILSNSNVISNSNSNTNANIIANILTNANVIANVLTNANVVANILTNANIVANVLTNANITTNVISNVSNTTSNIANITGNVMLGTGLNPGFMAPTAFYNTNDPAQSMFNWGQGGYQPGPTFNEVLYNQAAAPNTPFGLQQLAKPLSSQQIQDMIMGREITTPTVAPATRKEQYVKGPVAPTYGQVKLNPAYKNTSTTTNATTSGGVTDQQYTKIVEKLGKNWATDLQVAAQNGNWEEYNRIQQEVNSILNPVVDRY